MIIKSLKYWLLAAYHEKRKHRQATVRAYREYFKRHPKNNRVRHTFLIKLLKAKRYDEILTCASTTSRTSRWSVKIALIKAEALTKLQRYDEAITIYKKLFKTSAKPHYINCKIADNYLLLENYADARDHYTSALATTPVSLRSSNDQLSYIYHSLGYISQQQGEVNDAGHQYKQAIRYAANVRVSSYGIGVMHFKRRWYQDAIEAFHEQLTETDERDEIYFYIARCYSRLSQQEEAAKYYKKFIDHDDVLDEQGRDINSKRVIFDAFMGRNYADSPRALYEQMRRDPHYKDYTFVWVFRRISLRHHLGILFNRRSQIVKYKSKQYFRLYATTKYWVTNSRLPFVTKADPSQVYIQCWHGTPLKRLGHDVVDSYDSAKYSNDEMALQYDREAEKLDYFISPSDYASGKFRSAFALDQFGKSDAVVEQGYPRNDRLANYEEAEVEKLRRKFKIPANKKVLLYAPTWRDNQHSDEQGYTYKTEADFDYLYKKLSKDWVILFRAHYFIANSFNFSKYGGFIKDVSKIDDVNDLYLVADTLMTDYSSVFFDYANLRRPMIFFMYDLDYYQKDLRGFYIDLQQLPGDIVKDEKSIASILSDLEGYTKKHTTAYQKFHDTYNYLDDGEASKRVLEKVIALKNDA